MLTVERNWHEFARQTAPFVHWQPQLDNVAWIKAIATCHVGPPRTMKACGPTRLPARTNCLPRKDRSRTQDFIKLWTGRHTPLTGPSVADQSPELQAIVPAKQGTLIIVCWAARLGCGGLHITGAPVKTMSKIALEALANQDLHEFSAYLAILEGTLDRASKLGSLVPRPPLSRVTRVGVTSSRTPPPKRWRRPRAEPKDQATRSSRSAHPLLDRTICGGASAWFFLRRSKRVTSANDCNRCRGRFNL